MALAFIEESVEDNYFKIKMDNMFNSIYEEKKNLYTLPIRENTKEKRIYKKRSTSKGL